MDNHLHIVSLDVPWPADYGGVVDIFYKIVWLHKIGIKIHLHCFTKGRQPQDELNKYCESVNYYPRKKISSISFSLPYIVSSRRHPSLLKNLQKDSYPILLEGIHCTYLLHNGSLANRKVFVRLHNVEFHYYKKLADHERNFLKKMYFYAERFLLKRYEKRLAGKASFWPMSLKDLIFYKTKLKAISINYLPVFTPWKNVVDISDKGCFCLYHGNLSVNENERVAEWLLKNVFNDINIPFVVAGKNPSAKMETLMHEHQNTCLVANPSDQEMQDLIKKAQVNILPSLNNTGVKLKLLNALYNGRHCLVNAATLNGVSLPGLCHIAEEPSEFKTLVEKLYQLPFTEELHQERHTALAASYDNEENARKMISWLY